MPSQKEILDLFEAYVKDAKSNPFKVMDFVGKDGFMVYRDRERPLSMGGFVLYCFAKGVKGMKKILRDPSLELVREFIELTIEEDQIAGGLAGIYNANIVVRLNNLVEKSEMRQELVEVRMKLDTVKNDHRLSEAPSDKISD